MNPIRELIIKLQETESYHYSNTTTTECSSVPTPRPEITTPSKQSTQNAQLQLKIKLAGPTLTLATLEKNQIHSLTIKQRVPLQRENLLLPTEFLNTSDSTREETATTLLTMANSLTSTSEPAKEPTEKKTSTPNRPTWLEFKDFYPNQLNGTRRLRIWSTYHSQMTRLLFKSLSNQPTKISKAR